MRTGPALGLSILAGAFLVTQSRVNADLTTDLSPRGVPLVASAVSFTLGAVVLGTFCIATGSLRPAHRRLRQGDDRWWFRLGGLGGASLVATSAAAVPVVGAALTTVFLLTGQTAGSMAADSVGLGPSGKHAVTGPRAAGAGLAVAALLVGASSHHLGLRPLLLAAVVVAGFLVAGQQAVNGRLQQASGSASYAAFVSFAGGATLLLVAVGVQAAVGALPHLHAHPSAWEYFGGLGGAAYITLAAVTVRVLGVLRLSLALVLGQLGGGLAFDLVAPTRSTHVTSATYAAVALTVLALAVSGLRRA